MTSTRPRGVNFQPVKGGQDSAGVDTAEEVGEPELAAYLRSLAGETSSSAGHLVAVGQATARSHLNRDEEEGAHFAGRVFAPIDDVTPFEYPIRVVSPSDLTRFPVFAPAGPVTHRLFDSDESFQATLEAVSAAGNELPSFLRDAKLEPPIDPSNATEWMRRIAQSDGFFSESHLRYAFADPLMRMLSDDGRFATEVAVRGPEGRRRGVVDYLIWIDGTPVPVEAKVSVPSERDFMRQLAKYTGPATFETRPPEKCSHGVVVAVDTLGVYLVLNGRLAGTADESPSLPRRGLTGVSIAALRSQLVELLHRS